MLKVFNWLFAKYTKEFLEFVITWTERAATILLAVAIIPMAIDYSLPFISNEQTEIASLHGAGLIISNLVVRLVKVSLFPEDK